MYANPSGPDRLARGKQRQGLGWRWSASTRDFSKATFSIDLTEDGKFRAIVGFPLNTRQATAPQRDVAKRRECERAFVNRRNLFSIVGMGAIALGGCTPYVAKPLVTMRSNTILAIPDPNHLRVAASELKHPYIRPGRSGSESRRVTEEAGVLAVLDQFRICGPPAISARSRRRSCCKRVCCQTRNWLHR